MSGSICERGGKWRARVMVAGQRASKTLDTREAAENWAATKAKGLALKRLSADRELMSLIPRRILDAISRVDYRADDVVTGAIPATQSVGVYFLIRSGEVVYVGKTTDLFLRLSKHRRDGKDFDAYNFIPCREGQLEQLESQYIAAFLPLGNCRL